MIMYHPVELLSSGVPSYLYSVSDPGNTRLLGTAAQKSVVAASLYLGGKDVIPVGVEGNM